MITYLIIALSVGFSFYSFSNRELFDRLKFNAVYIQRDKEWYRFVSYGLIHADWMHLLVNMWVLFSFGGIVEDVFGMHSTGSGKLLFLGLYLGGLVLSTVFDFLKNKENIYYNAVGASGAVSSVVFASILLYPQGKIYLMLIPIGIPAPIFGLIYLAYSAYMAKNSNDNIGHSAHFWGSVYGLLYVVIFIPNVLQYFMNYLTGA